jgi:hypothetical protein
MGVRQYRDENLFQPEPQTRTSILVGQIFDTPDDHRLPYENNIKFNP